MDKYSLSVIIPIYNAETTLKQCLDSVLNQTYKEFEVILVDDGSVDKSPVLCDEYAQRDKRVTVMHIENAGPFQARKRGAKRASGEILTFADSDDMLEKNAFEASLQIFREQKPDILAYTYDYGKGTIEKNVYEEGIYCEGEIKKEIIPGMMFDAALGARRLNPSLCCKLIKRKLFLQVTESVKDRITFGEDALVTYPAVGRAKRIFISNQVFYHYNNNELSCTHTFPLERITEVKAFQDHIMRLFNEIGMLDRVKYQIENYVRSFFSMMIRSWYGIELSSVVYAFPYSSVLKDAEIFIYGAGIVGKSYINALKITNYGHIAGWADRNCDKLREYNNVNIMAPERIKQETFDVLLIAVWDEEAAKEIRDSLLKLGIPKEKILWKKPICIL